jgi:hypothetical protein
MGAANTDHSDLSRLTTHHSHPHTPPRSSTLTLTHSHRVTHTHALSHTHSHLTPLPSTPQSHSSPTAGQFHRYSPPVSALSHTAPPRALSRTIPTASPNRPTPPLIRPLLRSLLRPLSLHPLLLFPAFLALTSCSPPPTSHPRSPPSSHHSPSPPPPYSHSHSTAQPSIHHTRTHTVAW